MLATRAVPFSPPKTARPGVGLDGGDTLRKLLVIAALAFGALGYGADSTATPSSTPTSVECKFRSGWVIGSADPANAGIEILDCGDRTKIELIEFQESPTGRLRITRARLELPLMVDPPIVPCGEEHDPAHTSNVLIIPAPDDSRLHPVALKAWKADLESWQLKELNPATVHCARLGPGGDD